MFFSFARFFFDFFFSSGNIGSENLRQLLSHVHACMRWIFTTQWTALGPKPKRIFYVGTETNKISNLCSCSIWLKPTCNIFFQHVKTQYQLNFQILFDFLFFRRLRSHILSVCKYACEQKEGCLWILQEGEGVGGGWSKNWLALVWMQRRGFIKKAYQGWR